MTSRGPFESLSLCDSVSLLSVPVLALTNLAGERWLQRKSWRVLQLQVCCSENEAIGVRASP